MRITLEADYALRIMCRLQKHSGKLLDAKSIAEEASVPQRFTLKILHKLHDGGLVSSKKGSAGGYFLSESADRVSLRRVIELIDGPLAISKCVDGNCGCSMHGDDMSECAIHHIFQAISEDLSAKLDRITIDDVTDAEVCIPDLIKNMIHE